MLSGPLQLMLSSLNAGHNLSTRPVYWRQWNEKRFDDEVIPFFKAFIRTCYSKSASLLTFPILYSPFHV